LRDLKAGRSDIRVKLYVTEMCIIHNLRPLFGSAVTGITAAYLIVLAQEIGDFLDVMYISCRTGDRVYVTGFRINSDMNLHAMISLITL